MMILNLILLVYHVKIFVKNASMEMNVQFVHHIEKKIVNHLVHAQMENMKFHQ